MHRALLLLETWLLQHFRIQQSERFLSAQDGENGVHRRLADGLEALIGPADGVRGQNHIFQCKERVVRSGRLLLETVDARAGDPPALVADAKKAAGVLKWKPQYPGIETIVEHAWKWQSTRR